MKRIILTPEQMDHALGLDRPKWSREILIDLATDPQPEWCEVCPDVNPNEVPSRATAVVNGINVCAGCARSHYEMTHEPLSRSK